MFVFGLGIALFVASIYIYRRYRQEKAYAMISNIGEDGYRIFSKA
jgi:hypothetical protein